jgi:hypothetical protein
MNAKEIPKVIKHNPIQRLWGDLGLEFYNFGWILELLFLEAFGSAESCSTNQGNWRYLFRVWPAHVFNILGRKTIPIQVMRLSPQRTIIPRSLLKVAVNPQTFTPDPIFLKTMDFA